MPEEELLKVKKIKLSDGNIYSIFDEGALRLNADKVLITGNEIVDKIIIDGHLSILEVDDVPVENTIDNVLVQDTETGEIMKRSTNKLLEDIGGCSYNMNDSTGTLSLKFGKQPDQNN